MNTTIFFSLIAVAFLWPPLSYLALITVRWRKEQNRLHDIEDAKTWLFSDPAFQDTPLFAETAARHAQRAAASLDKEWRDMNRGAIHGLDQIRPRLADWRRSRK